MENSKREIESFLYLYPSAIKYYDSIKYNQQKVSNKQLKQMETFYGILIDIVNDWMKVLLKDEIVIIKYKYFNCLNYTQIAIVSIPLSEVHAIRYRSPHNPLKKSIFF